MPQNLGSLTQFGAELELGTARLTPGQDDSAVAPRLVPERDRPERSDPAMEDLLSFANDRDTFSSDPEFDEIIGAFKEMDEREGLLQEYGAATRKWYFDDTPKDEVLGYLESTYSPQTSKDIYKNVTSFWKPYKDMYKVAGEYARNERIDPGYVQNLDAEDRKLFYAFMAEQASPEQRGAFGAFGENWLRGMEDVWDSWEEDLSKFTGLEFKKQHVPLGGGVSATLPVLQFSKEGGSLEAEAAVADAAETRRRIRRVREAGDPVEAEGLLGEAALGVARMGPRLGAGILAAQLGPAGTIAYWTSQIAPDLEDEMVEMGVNPENAATFSLLAAIPSAAVEASQVKKLTPGASEAVRRGAIGFLAGYAKKFGKHWAAEVGEEGVQFLIEEAGKHAALAAEGEMPDIDWGDIITRGTEEMRQAGLSLGLLTAMGHIPGGMRGVRIATKQQLLYDKALLVAEKSADQKMKQYANTIVKMIDLQTPIDKKSRGLVERVTQEAESIRLKQSLIEVAEGRVAEKAADAAKVTEAVEKGKAKAEEAKVAKQAVAEPQKPVAKPAPAPKQAVAKKVEAPKAKPEAPAAAIAEQMAAVEEVRARGREAAAKREAAAIEKQKVAEVKKEAAPPPPAAPKGATEFTQKKLVRIVKTKSGMGIRQIAIRVDKALKAGKVSEGEARHLYTQLGLQTVQIEKIEGVKLPQIKESLRKRMRVAPAAVKAAPPAATRKQQARVNKLRKDIRFRESTVKTMKVEKRTAERANKDRVAAAIGSRISFNEKEINKIKAELAGASKALGQVKAQAPAEKRQPAAAAPPLLKSVSEAAVPILKPIGEKAQPAAKPKQAPVAVPAQAVPVGKEAPRMGEKVAKPAPKAVTEHSRAQAAQELEIDEQTTAELGEEMRERGLNPMGLSHKQMVDAVIRDAVAGGEIAPVARIGEAEVAPRAEAVPEHKRPITPVQEGVASLDFMSDNEIRELRDRITVGLSEIESRYGQKESARKFEATHVQSSAQSIVRRAAETGNYEAASDKLIDLRKAYQSKFGKKSQARKDFRQEYATALELAISEFDTIVGGNTPETILGKRQQIKEVTERTQEAERLLDEFRRADAAFDAAASAIDATTQTQDVALIGGEKPQTEVPVVDTAHAKAAIAKADREAEAIGLASPAQLYAASIKEMTNPAEIQEAYNDMGPALAAEVKSLVIAQSTKTDDVRRSTEDPDTTNFRVGITPGDFKVMTDAAAGIWEDVASGVMSGYKLGKNRPPVLEALRNAIGSLGYTQAKARQTVVDQFKDVTEEDAKAVFFWRDDPTRHPLPKHLTEVGEQLNEVYIVIEGMWKQMGLGTWPASRINANGAKIKALRAEISQFKPGTRKHRLRLREIADLEAENRFLADLRYQRHLVLGKKSKITPEVAVSLDKMAQSGALKERINSRPDRALGRKYARAEDLIADDFVVETDFRVALADVFSYVQSKLVIYEFHENVIKSDPTLARPSKEAPEGWVELPGIEPYNRNRYRSGTTTYKVMAPDGTVRTERRANYKFRGASWKVHPMLAEAIRDFTETGGHIYAPWKLYDHFSSMMKQLRFYNPLIMTMNNIPQGFAAAGFRSWLNWPAALVEATRQGPEYFAMLEANLFSIPGDIPVDVYNDVVRADLAAHHSGSTKFMKWLKHNTGITTLKDMWKLLPVTPRSALYKMNRNITWWMDRVARIATTKALRKQKNPATGKLYTMQEAVIKARTFHGDYGLLRRTTSKWLKRIFLTPSFKFAMWGKAFPLIVKEGVLGAGQFVTKGPGGVTHDVMPMARVLAAISAMTASMALLGYSWEDWYRFVKKGEDDEGEDVIQMFGPFAEPFKVAGRAISGYQEDGFSKAIERVLFNNLAALPKMAASIQRNRDWRGKQIITPGAPRWQKRMEMAHFILRDIYPYVGQIESWGDAEQSTIAKMANVAAITMYHRDSTKRQWFTDKLQERQRDVRKWASDKAGGDPELARQYNIDAAKRYAEYTVALSEAMATYDSRLEAMKTKGAWERLMVQFDQFAWFHTKLEPGGPSLLTEKKLSELRALKTGPVRARPGDTKADIIDRLMRKVFAGAFLREVAEHD